MTPFNINKIEKANYEWIKIDTSRCDKCGICVEYCPMDVLSMDSKGYPYMKYRDDCWYCDVCTFFCHRKAVSMDDLPYLIS
jgi:NAD-dependent dihydropyrimidine dehydrogenase PreA subunit